MSFTFCHLFWSMGSHFLIKVQPGIVQDLVGLEKEWFATLVVSVL